MKKIGLILGVILGGILLCILGTAIYLISVRNQLLRKSEDVKNAWAQVENQYQRRLDLFSNLEQVAGAQLAQERSIFEMITQARAAFAGAKTMDEKISTVNQYENQLSIAVGRIVALAESNPEIKSSDVIMQVIYSIESTQNQVSTERRRYNDQVTEYNKMIKVFPNNIIASLFGFKEEFKRYEAEPAALQNPNINLNVPQD